jgi:hypothetical protein
MKPDSAKLAALSAVIGRDLAALDRLHAQLLELSGALNTAAPPFRDMAATAYVLHNLELTAALTRFREHLLSQVRA